MLLGTKIRSLRDERGILQRQVVASIFYSFRRYSEKKALTLPKILKIANRLNVYYPKISEWAFSRNA